MATKIVTKNSSTASAVPTASDLVQGELAVNVADKRLFTEDNGGSIIELGTNPSTIDINAGSIDGTAIGASSASTGAFTTLTATGLTVDTNTLYVDSTNNRVGIGTTSPDQKLEVDGAVKVTNFFTGETSTNSGYFDFVPSTSTARITTKGNDGSTLGKFQILQQASDGSPSATPFYIDTNSNVGIGTSSPSVPVHVYKSQASPTIVAKFENPADEAIVEIKSKNTDLGVLQFADTEDANVGAVQYSHSDNSMRFKTNDSERMRIDSSGNVGIGTSSPTFKLDVAGNARANYFALRANESAPSESAFVYRPATGVLGFGTSSAERMRIDSSGNLLVGSTNTDPAVNNVEGFSYKSGNEMQVNRYAGEAAIFGRGSNNGSVVGFRRSGTAVGSISVTTTSTSYNTSSDQRLKENIADADDAGSKIDAIQVRQYDWKADGSHQDYGMIAQELQAVAPEAVSGDADSEEMMGVDYSKLVPMLIKEIQSLRNRVAQLEE